MEFKMKLFYRVASALFLSCTVQATSIEEMKEDLKTIRLKAEKSIPSKPSLEVFVVTEELSKGYQKIVKDACGLAFKKYSDLKDVISVGLTGSTVWGEATLRSDAEFMFLVKNYTYYIQATEFANYLGDILADLKDKHFKMDRGTPESGLEILSNLHYIFTPQDAFNFASNHHHLIGYDQDAKKKAQNIVATYMRQLQNIFEIDQVPDGIEDFFNEKCREFMGESLNSVFVGGQEEIYKEYQSLRTQQVETIEQEKEKTGTCYSAMCFTSLLNATDSEGNIKSNWRKVSHIVRVLGGMAGCTEMGSYKTLQFLKKLEVLEEDTYDSLLNDATISVWNRLKESTGSTLKVERLDDMFTIDFFNDKVWPFQIGEKDTI
jgi:hypothetical protein